MPWTHSKLSNEQYFHVLCANADNENTPPSSTVVSAAHFASTPPAAVVPSRQAAAQTLLGGADLETPVGARNLPTPFGTMGRAALPPTPFAPGSVTPGLSSSAAAQLSSWRSRAGNAAFKGRSPPSSRLRATHQLTTQQILPLIALFLKYIYHTCKSHVAFSEAVC